VFAAEADTTWPIVTRAGASRQTIDLGVDYNGFNQVYQAGGCYQQTGHVLTIETALDEDRPFRRGLRVGSCDYSDELDSVDARGHVAVPTGPGLGTPVDGQFIRRQQTDQVVYE
jgi:hypothetical protein